MHINFTSNKVTKPLQSLLLSQTSTFSSDIRGEQLLIKNEIYRLKFSMTSSNKASLLEGATTSLKRSIELASVKGASNWLTVLSFYLCSSTITFHDAVALRYGWDPRGRSGGGGGGGGGGGVQRVPWNPLLREPVLLEIL